ncbi:MAG: hypothetical protein IJ660_04070, partial [Alphaproteobacteria bacterium]|nr:hypothetical protein [Alphaproteobacteria bacterium]
ACPEHGVCTSKTCGGTTKYTLNSCEGGESTQLTCNVGDIYYSDDTCSSDVISGKTPIGVVYDTEHKLVVGLEEGNAMWGGYGTDVPDIANPSNVYAARDDLEGKSHTNVLVSLGGYPAAKYCYDMTTGGKEWYLPAFGELYKMYTANGSSEGYVMLNKVFNAIGGTPIDSDGYWTSTEVDWAGAGRLNPPAAYLYGGTIKTSESSVRCIFSYTEGTTTTYVKQNNTCVKDCSLDGYDLDSCPEHRICTSKTCGGITKYKSGECENGYTLENGTCNVCHAGDIYYSDDTCSSTIISCKTPIGVVYDVTNKLVVSLDESVRLQWGKEGVVDSPVPNDYDEAFYDEDGVYYRSHDFNGKSNTDILVASGIYPAAHYCHNMTTGGREWYLPALGEMWQMSTNITAIDNTLSTVGTKLIQSEEWDKDMYLSSSEYNDEYTWFFRLLQHFAPTVNKITPEYVRCIFTYKDSATTYVESDNTCSQNCSFDGYPLTECPRFARCRMKTCNGTRRFGVTECQPSFKLIGDTCERICPTTYLRGLISEDSIIYDDFLEHSVIMQASPSDSEMSGYVGDFYATRMYAENKQCDIEFIQERVSKLFPGAYIRIIAAEPATTHGSSGEICRHCSVHVEERRYDENGHMMYMNSRNQVF